MTQRGMVEVRLVLHHETGSAWKVSEEGDPEATFWLPRSQCTMDEHPAGRHKFWDVHDFEIPEWLAREKGIV